MERLRMEDLMQDLLDYETTFPFDLPQYSPVSSESVRDKRTTVDMRENDTGYILDIGLPDYTKDQIRLDLEDGFLTVTAQSHRDHNETDSYGRTVVKEYFTDTLQRSIYVGQSVTADDVRAEYDSGVLHVEISKSPAVPAPAADRIPIR